MFAPDSNPTKDPLGSRRAGPWNFIAYAMCGLSVVAALAPAGRSAAAGERLALVIANGEYPGRGNDGQLASPHQDAQAMRDWLLSLGMKVILLENQTVGRALREFARLEAMTEGPHKAEEIVIYYSGHGTLVADDVDPDEVPADKDQLDEAFVFPGASSEEVLMRDDVFFTHVEALSKRTKRLVVVLDTCYAAGLPKGRFDNKAIALDEIYRWKGILPKSLPEGSNEKKQGTESLTDAKKASFEGSVVVLAACRDNQIAAGAFEDGMSAFTYLLLQGLKNKPEQTLGELKADVERRLANTVEGQTPVVETFGAITLDTQVVGGILTDSGPPPNAEVPRANLGDVYVRISRPAHAATVRALAFAPGQEATTLYSAGDDKLIRVWRKSPVALAALGGKAEAWQADPKPIVWEAGQGNRGSIYTLDVSPADGSLIVGGLSHRGANGVLTHIDPVLGKYIGWEPREQDIAGQLQLQPNRHTESVLTIKFSPDGKQIASQDLNGHLAWRSLPLGSPIDAMPVKVAGPRELKSLAFLDDSTIVVPEPATEKYQWHLVKYNRQTKAAGPMKGSLKGTTKPAIHWYRVSALASDGAGSLASADGAGNLYYWNGGVPEAITETPKSGGAEELKCLALTRSHVLAGYANGKVIAWRLADKRSFVLREPSPGGPAVLACALSHDGRWAAYALGSDIFIRPLDAVAPGQTFSGTGVQRLRLAEKADGVAFDVAISALAEPGKEPAEFHYDVLFQTTDGKQRYYDPEGGLLREIDPPLPIAVNLDANWSVEVKKDLPAGAQPTEDEQVLSITTPSGRRFTLKLDRWKHGIYSGVFRAIPPVGPDGIWSIALATDGGYSSIYLYGLPGTGQALSSDRPLRTFAGHEAAITAMVLAAPQGRERYLVTASLDGSVRYWSLHGLDRGKPVEEGSEALMQRWGFDLRTRPRAGAPGNELFVHEIRDTGPTLQKGFRQGDVITALKWFDREGKAQFKVDPNEIWHDLRDMPWDAMPLFTVVRDGKPAFTAFIGGKPVPLLQTRSAWHHTLAVTVSGQEWVAWNPLGYFASSVNGGKLVSWQVHSELPGSEPIVFTADQKPNLDQSDLLKGLLERGTLDRRMAALERAVPPKVTIDSVVTGNDPEVAAMMSLEVTATVKAEDRYGLAEPQLLINGKQALGKRSVTAVAAGRGVQYQWKIDGLWRQAYKVAVYGFSRGEKDAALDHTESVAEREIPGPPAPKKSRLFVVAIGVSDYQNKEFTTLKYANEDAAAFQRAIFNQFVEGSGMSAFYDKKCVGHSSGPLQNATYAQIEERLQWLKDNVTENDVALIFYSGHGELRVFDRNQNVPSQFVVNAKGTGGNDTRPNRNQGFLIPSDAWKEDASCKIGNDTELENWINAYRKKRWMPFDDIVNKCRKDIKGPVLLILDACRSGCANAVAKQTNDGCAMTWASCNAGELSWQADRLQSSVFTYCLTNLLDGKEGRGRLQQLVPNLNLPLLKLGLGDGDNNGVVEPDRFGDDFPIVVEAVCQAMTGNKQRPCFNSDNTKVRIGIANPEW